MDSGLCLLVTEFGTCKATANGEPDYEETDRWLSWLDKYQIGWCNWSVNDKDESPSILNPGANYWGNWLDTHLTETGKYIRDKLLE